MVEPLKRWMPQDRAGAYAELEHPADLLLEVWGRDLPDLVENALFALYDQLAELEGFTARQTESIAVEGPTAAEALRSLLSEALYRFAAEGFVAVKAGVEAARDTAGTVKLAARLHGERVDRERHTLLTEVKAVTYHRLAVEETARGSWRATVLFDV